MDPNRPRSEDGPLQGHIAGAEAAYFQEAASFAARAHRHQIRKDGRTPYVAHVFRVAMTVALVFECDDRVAILAGLLHDTIEDTTTDFDDLEERFGSAVAECVAALTKNMAMRDALRERAYDAQLAQGPWQARLVKLADVYDNLCDLTDRPVGTSESAGEMRRKALERAHRALELIRGDLGRPEIARGADAVRRLVDAARGEQVKR
jgi:guanosine-3',5'-bis(diphosphate) 3'-pyrophosphohydrolase